MSLILRQWQPIGDDEIMTNTLWQWPSDRQWQWQSDDCNEQLQSLGVIGPIGSICVSCQALLAQVTWAVAFSLCWRFQPWTLSDFWKWWWTKRRRWRWQKFQSLEHLIVDVKTHSARKGKNRLYVGHNQSLSWGSPWCPSCQSWAIQRLVKLVSNTGFH